ncbi:MAG: DEAD/DEAH box helicase [Betaproteobacteria bacterium]|nr:DEAD/DEAH box helicase [Betaproteobacteria bacterium]
MTDLQAFHPAVAAWFERTFAVPTPCQSLAWPALRSGRHTLIAAPTGSGKTLAALLAALDDLVRQATEERLADATQIVYVSPLKALSNDVRCNLDVPLAGIRDELARMGCQDAPIRAMVRTGDTPAAERAAMRRRAPHIVVTTPESLYLLLTAESGRRMLATTRTVIIDEIHALAGTKRGAHLALSLERLQALAAAPLTRVGVSATQSPIEGVARFLVGAGSPDDAAAPDCMIVDTGHRRDLRLSVELPDTPLHAVLSTDGWEQVYDRLAALVRTHRTTLVFANTRRMAERVARHLSERLGNGSVTAHHGSLSRAQRWSAEQRLKGGHLKALVATASLELGIDIGHVDLVCQLGSPRSISAFLQRVGRSGHGVGAISEGAVFPLTRDDLMECLAILRAVRAGEIDRLRFLDEPLDVLAQQLTAEVAACEWAEDALYHQFRRAHPYRHLSRDTWEACLRMLSEGFSTTHGRRGAYLHYDRVQGKLRGRRGARLAALTSGGAIPDNADYDVVLEPEGLRVGSVNEDFAVESLVGDIFQLGNQSYRILRIETGRVRVEDAKGQPPNIPFWLGEAPSRSDELSKAVADLREAIAARLAQPQAIDGMSQWLCAATACSPAAAQQAVDYLAAAQANLGTVPTQQRIVLERFFDDAGAMQLIVHAPLGARINRAWGLALRKRFCRKFNFELQAAATDDAIILSLSTTHSFPLEEVAHYLRAQSVRALLVQAVLDAPMFTVRWRWVAGIALAVLRMRGGKKNPPFLQRMQAEDLAAVAFPDSRACFENIQGEREIPDHPLVKQALRDCLFDAMDVEGLERILAGIEQGEIAVLARDLTEPSPLAYEILAARPYAFLDDAPLEERRAHAVRTRRWADPAAAADLGRLDPDAIARAVDESWPSMTTPDEVHDALLTLGYLCADEIRVRAGEAHASVFSLLEKLAAEGRAAAIDIPGGRARWVAVERLPEFRVLYADSGLAPGACVPDGCKGERWSADTALASIIRSRLPVCGPITAQTLARGLGLSEAPIQAALAALEAEGSVLRGRFRPDGEGVEWCERGLTARIHRLTIHRLRAEIEPVSGQVFMRFLCAWQGLTPEQSREGQGSLAAVVEQLAGWEAPAAVWETEILPARISDYDPAMLDALCLSGHVTWGRLSSTGPGIARLSPNTPIALFPRHGTGAFERAHAARGAPALSASAERVACFLAERGASFFGEIVDGTRLLRAQVEDCLGELVAQGMATADGFSGLRVLMVPGSKRRPSATRARHRFAASGFESAGRWTLFNRPRPGEIAAIASHPDRTFDEENLEHAARALLRRYGVVCRPFSERDSFRAPWRELLPILRRLEARGEVRGGRFVASVGGEQFALPEAVGLLRTIRRVPGDGAWVRLSAADPLSVAASCLVGLHVPATRAHRLLFRDGVLVAAWSAGQVKFFNARTAAEEQWATACLDVPSASSAARLQIRLVGWAKASNGD